MNNIATHPLTADQKIRLQNSFADRMQSNIQLARYTAARIGGPADALIVVETVDDLAQTALTLWNFDIPFFLLGGGSNILVSDLGFQGVVILNRAKEIKIDDHSPSVWSGSGASFGQVARKVSKRGFSGLEWATGIPGSVGGAVFGNAGAHGGDIAGDLQMVEILHRDGSREQWSSQEMGYDYRSSVLKRDSIPAIILSAQFKLAHSLSENTEKLTKEYAEIRQQTQPPGASMGSMFKNPTGDYAGRLIEAAGLKGTRIGNAEISPVHANFFINHGETKASAFFSLIRLARDTVYEKFGIELELEIELVGPFLVEPSTQIVQENIYGA